MVSIEEPFDNHHFAWTLTLISLIYLLLISIEPNPLFVVIQKFNVYFVLLVITLIALTFHHIDNTLLNKRMKNFKIKVGKEIQIGFWYEPTLYLTTIITLVLLYLEDIPSDYKFKWGLFLLTLISFIYKLLRCMITHTPFYKLIKEKNNLNQPFFGDTIKPQDKCDIDLKKLTKEDRLYLLNFWTEQTKWNGNNILTALSNYLGVLALLISSLAIVIAIEGRVDNIVICASIFIIFTMLLSYKFYADAKATFCKLGYTADARFKELFEIHFRYSNSKKK